MLRTRSPWILCAAAVSISAQPSGLAGWLRAIEAADRSILAPDTRPPDGMAAELQIRIPALNDSARIVAAGVLRKVDSPESGSLLLQLVRDPGQGVAAAASRALRDSRNLPPGEDILRVIPALPVAVIRSHLFLAAGRARTSLTALRLVLDKEPDFLARNAGRAAAIRLGGVSERAALALAVRQSRAEDLVRLLDLSVYTQDRRMGSALLPLFGSREPIMQISSDADSLMATRADLAVWTAHELGLIPQLRLTRLRRFDAATIAAARAACAKAK